MWSKDSSNSKAPKCFNSCYNSTASPNVNCQVIQTIFNIYLTKFAGLSKEPCEISKSINWIFSGNKQNLLHYKISASNVTKNNSLSEK